MGANASSTAELLAGIPFFADFTRREIKTLVNSGDEVAFPAGKALTIEGQPGREAFLILDGIVSVRRSKGKVLKLGAGSVVGELALLDNGPRLASVVCETDVVAFVISQRYFREVLRGSPTLSGKLLLQLAQRLRELSKGV